MRRERELRAQQMMEVSYFYKQLNCICLHFKCTLLKQTYISVQEREMKRQQAVLLKEQVGFLHVHPSYLSIACLGTLSGYPTAA
jgi:hypothetical protein